MCEVESNFLCGEFFFSSSPFPHHSNMPQRHLGFLLSSICQSVCPSSNTTLSGLLQLQNNLSSGGASPPCLSFFRLTVANLGEIHFTSSPTHMYKHKHHHTTVSRTFLTSVGPQYIYSILFCYPPKKKNSRHHRPNWFHVLLMCNEAQGLKCFVPRATLDGQDLTWTFIKLFIHSFSKYYGHIKYSGTGWTVLHARNATEKKTDPIQFWHHVYNLGWTNPQRGSLGDDLETIR